MQIIKYEKLKNYVYKIEFDNEIFLELFDDVIIKYELLRKKNITDSEYKEIKSYNDKLNAYYDSLNYLNKKMRTKIEIIKYLEKKDYPVKVIEETIKRLYDNKALNDELYIKAYVNDKINFSNIGPNKIISKLEQLGINKEDAYAYLKTIDENIWKDKLIKLINKKIKLNNKYSINMLKNKIKTSLVSDGYNIKMINEIIDEQNIQSSNDIIKKEYIKIKNKLEKKYNSKELEYQVKLKMMTKGFTSLEIETIKKEI